MQINVRGAAGDLEKGRGYNEDKGGGNEAVKDVS